MSNDTREERPDTLNTEAQRIQTGSGKVYVNINTDDNGRPLEVFINAGSSGGYTHSWGESLGKTISNALRSGADMEELAEDLMGIRGGKIDYDNGDVILSIPDAVGVAMKRHVLGKQGESIREHSEEIGMP